MIKFIFNRFLPPSPYVAMAFMNLIFIREGVVPTTRLIAHELVHVDQYKRLGVVKFLWIWFSEYFKHGVKKGFRQGYYDISLEIEAREKEETHYYITWAESVMEENGVESTR